MIFIIKFFSVGVVAGHRPEDRNSIPDYDREFSLPLFTKNFSRPLSSLPISVNAGDKLSAAHFTEFYFKCHLNWLHYLVLN